jgi:hypothetical protein
MTIGAEAAGDTAKPGFWNQLRHWWEERSRITQSYLVSSAGIGYTAFQDTRMTPMIYRAPGFPVLTQHITKRPQEMILTHLFFQFSYPITEPNLSGESLFINPRGTIDTSYLRRIADLPLWIGGSFSGTFNLRLADSLSNSMLNFDILTCLGPAVRWDEDFILFRQPATYHLMASLPLVSHVLRNPLYNTSYGGNEMFFAPPWELYRLRFNAGMARRFPRSNENSLSIDYFYDLYGLARRDKPHDLVTGIHSLVFGFSMKLR